MKRCVDCQHLTITRWKRQDLLEERIEYICRGIIHPVWGKPMTPGDALTQRSAAGFCGPDATFFAPIKVQDTPSQPYEVREWNPPPSTFIYRDDQRLVPRYNTAETSTMHDIKDIIALYPDVRFSVTNGSRGDQGLYKVSCTIDTVRDEMDRKSFYLSVPEIVELVEDGLIRAGDMPVALSQDIFKEVMTQYEGLINGIDPRTEFVDAVHRDGNWYLIVSSLYGSSDDDCIFENQISETEACYLMDHGLVPDLRQKV